MWTEPIRPTTPPPPDSEDTTSSAGAVECYACTQVGVPAFHSTSCDHAHQQPEWEASAGSSLIPIQPTKSFSRLPHSSPRFGPVLDPRTKRVQLWNRALLLARGMALAVDPLYFYALSIGRGGSPCLYMDGALAAAVTALRTCLDLLHLWHVWLQFRLAYVSRESMVIGCGKLVWDARAIASHYLRSIRGFWFDAFVILPVPQIVYWLVLPKLIREEKIKLIMTVILIMFLFQFLPKVYHSIILMRRMQKVTGYIFGTIWWGFGLNLIAYFIASHVAGGCWYVLAIQRVASCIQQHCERNKCNLSLSCSEEVCYQFLSSNTMIGNSCGRNSTAAFRQPLCLDVKGPFAYGIYKWALPVISSNSISVKILYPIFWGLMTLSTFGNDLEPTSNWLEVCFSICTVLSGLLLFTLLIGNIQVLLHAVMARRRKMQLRCRDLEWWMRRRQLPSRLRQRVRHYEHQRWAAMGGEDEMELINDLPEGLRRDIKGHLCVDLIKKVPLFQNLEKLILDNICDRVKPLVFSKDEKIIREGDPVPRMLFIVCGRVERSQSLSKGMTATSLIEPGGFLGDTGGVYEGSIPRVKPEVTIQSAQKLERSKNTNAPSSFGGSSEIELHQIPLQRPVQMLHLRRIQRNRRRFHQKVQIQVAHLVHLERPPSHQRRDLDSVEDQHEIALREACVCPSVSILCSDHDLHLDLKA